MVKMDTAGLPAMEVKGNGTGLNCTIKNYMWGIANNLTQGMAIHHSEAKKYK